MNPHFLPVHFRERIVADGNDRVQWLKARSRGITATDVAKLSTPKSVEQVAWNKLFGSGFTGNAYTEHGKRREPEAEWVLGEFELVSQALFHAGRIPGTLPPQTGLLNAEERWSLLVEPPINLALHSQTLSATDLVATVRARC